jgi:hypothetical protein
MTSSLSEQAALRPGPRIQEAGSINFVIVLVVVLVVVLEERLEGLLRCVGTPIVTGNPRNLISPYIEHDNDRNATPPPAPRL